MFIGALTNIDVSEIGYDYHYNGDYGGAIAYYEIIVELSKDSYQIAESLYDIGVSYQVCDNSLNSHIGLDVLLIFSHSFHVPLESTQGTLLEPVTTTRAPRKKIQSTSEPT